MYECGGLLAPLGVPGCEVPGEMLTDRRGRTTPLPIAAAYQSPAGGGDHLPVPVGGDDEECFDTTPASTMWASCVFPERSGGRDFDYEPSSRIDRRESSRIDGGGCGLFLVLAAAAAAVILSSNRRGRA
jgi:hypothetical protein